MRVPMTPQRLSLSPLARNECLPIRRQGQLEKAKPVRAEICVKWNRPLQRLPVRCSKECRYAKNPNVNVTARHSAPAALLH
jgi:hypothetical protein